MNICRNIVCVICLILSLVFALFMPGCGKPEVEPITQTSEAAQKLYYRSQQELKQGEYEKAYHSYQKAVAEDKNIANIAHLSSILYSWVISQSEALDVPLLEAQKWVWLEPNQIDRRKRLVSVAVDDEKGIIYAFGLGIAPDNIVNPGQRDRLAQKSAMADAKAWVARLSKWSADDIKCPFDVTETVVGVEVTKDFWVEDKIYVVGLRAPINCLGQKIKS